VGKSGGPPFRKGLLTRSKARRSYCLSHFGRGLKSNEKWLLCSGGCGGIPPTKEARSTKLDPPLHANTIHFRRRQAVSRCLMSHVVRIKNQIIIGSF
jgi:hypothetical protein